jgi:methyl-accepting chemotaxis protein
MRFLQALARHWRVLPALSLRSRLILRLVGLLLLLLVVGGVAGLSLWHADRRMGALVADALSPLSDVGRIQNDYSDSLNALTHAGLTRLPSALEEARTQIQSNRVEIGRRWEHLRSSGLAREQAQLLALTDTHRKAAEQAVDDALMQLEAEQYDLAQLQIASDVQPAFVPLHADFANLFAKAVQTGEEAVAAAHASSRRVQFLLAAVLMGGLLAALLLDGLLIRAITRRLSQAVAVTQRIADGVLGHALQVGDHDEIGALLRALQRMDLRLADVVREVQQGALGVTRSADRLARDNDTLRERTRTQADSLERSAASMERLTETVRRNADHAALADRLAAAAREQAEAGSGIVAQTSRSVDAIGDAHRRMGDIVAAIDTLAFQTRLLALNAAVEAAHAGAHGRGFAVVADEVRQLAQRSTEAAREIRGLIEDSHARVEAGAVLAAHSGDVLIRIVEGAAQVSQAVAAIRASSREQSEGIGEIDAAVRHMDEGTRQNARLVGDVADAGRALRGQADALTALVGFFRSADSPVEEGAKA